MIELPPMDSVALSLHHAPGVYALLVGSGLSTAAGIPTGWGITLELVRRLAVLQGVTEPQNHEHLEKWYEQTYKKPPSYSELVEAVALTADERRNILHEFIEPREGEETRRPCKAHKAFAKLVATGAVKVIITTNFDRLIETALKDADVAPTVIASDDALQGATPLVHSRCTVIKVHGDYLDARIKNTDDELTGYSERMNRLLDEVFDTFGLIVAGWSATWDKALCEAILRAPSRRYSLYWAHRGALGPEARDIVEARGGRTIEISDADSFFGKLVDSVEVLRRSSGPHPQSTALVLQLAKKYCRDDKYDAEWAELLLSELNGAKDLIGEIEMNAHDADVVINMTISHFTKEDFILRSASFVCGRWGTLSAKRNLINSIRELSFQGKPVSGPSNLVSLRECAFSICSYWLLSGLIEANDWNSASALFESSLRSNDTIVSFIKIMPFGTYHVDWRTLNGFKDRTTPMSDLLHSIFQSDAKLLSLTNDRAEELFDQTEMLIALQYAHVIPSGFGNPVGRFAWKADRRDRLLSQFAELPANSPILQSGLLGGTPASARTAVRAVKEFIQNSSRFF